MSNATPARPADLIIGQDEIAASAFLVRYGPETRRGYKLNLGQWFAWCKEHGIRPLEAARPHIELWARELDEAHHLKPTTINGKLNVVCGFYKLAKIDGFILDDPSLHIRRPNIPRESSTNGLTRAEFYRCLDVAQKTDPQAHALWCLLGLSGPRISEALRLDVDDLGFQGGYRTVNLVRSKGGRSGVIPLAPRTSNAIDRHLGSRKSGPLFVKPRKDERMDQKSANRVVKRIGKLAGVDKRLHPHVLRHTFTTLSLNAGVSARDVANSRGDADLRQVSYYDREKDALARNATHMLAAYVEGI